MVRSALTSVLLLLLASGCANDQPLMLKRQSLSETNLPSCKTDECPSITVNYLEAVGPEEIAQRINGAIEQELIGSLKLGPEDVEAPATVKDAMQQFIQTYQTHLAEFPDMPAQYTAEVNIDKFYQSDTLLSLGVNQYRYTGGAHGYGQIHFLNFLPDTGELLTTKDLFADLNGFRALAEAHFRVAYQISPDAPINSTGFWFEGDRFSLPQTVGFTASEVVLQYNQYDIASYADGPIELRIPKSEVQPYLESLDP